MSLLDNLVDLGTGTYSVTRTAAATYVDGVMVPGASSSFNVAAIVVPVTGRDLVALQTMDAQYTADTSKMFTSVKLQVRTDKITIDGEPWTVRQVQRWDLNADSVHYESIITRDATT